MAPLKAIDKKVSRLTDRAQLTLFWERLWPSLFLLIMAGLFYCALAWLGVWNSFPAFLRVLGLFVFGLYGLYFLIKIIRTPFPTRREAVSFLEENSSVAHRPLSTYLDKPALLVSDENPLQKSLWKAHQERLLKSVLLIENVWPKAQVQKLDRYGARAFIILLAVIGFHFAGPERLARLSDAFSFSAQQDVLPVRLDAWVTPPDYTDKAPVFLTRDAGNPLDEPLEQKFLIPQGSVVTIRLVNAKNSAVIFQSSDGQEFLLEPEQTQNQDGEFAAQRDYVHVLKETGLLKISYEEGEKDWRFDVIKDLAPEISFVQAPEIQRSGAMEVLARIRDDYGVYKAEAKFFPIKDERGEKEAKPLYEAPFFDLRLRRGKVKDGVSKTLHSLVEHPWAGSDVLMQLTAFDDAGQEGKSELLEFVLPKRPFNKPLAKVLVEQRRLLALDAQYAGELIEIIDVLTLWPEQFEKDLAAFIALASIRRGLLSARNDNDLRNIVDDLWQLALAIEEGDVSDAEKALKSALEALREGIRNGASSEEIARLMDDVRQALNEYIQALANQAQDGDLAENQNQPDNNQALDTQDLQDMLDRIQELAETGSRDAAENLLSELQQMMENLQAQQQNGNGEENSARQMLNELGDMIRQQQRLMDQTFREGQRQGQTQNQGQGQQNQGQQNQGQNGQGQEQGASGQGGNQEGLSEGQGQLADRLGEFLNGLGSQGDNPALSPNGQQGDGGQRQLNDARRSMRGAAGALQQGDLDAAGDMQSEALNQLRDGAQRLSEQLAGEQSGQGSRGRGQQARGRDPLGRQNGGQGSDFGDDVDVPDEIDTQRAREILDVIRKRLGERLRPQDELDYLERLLTE